MFEGVTSFVWQDPPGVDAEGVTHWAIKAANGNGHTAPDGFDFRDNAQAWADKKGEDNVSGWTWLYATTDGAVAAQQLVDSLPHAPSYGCDVEGDDPGVSPAHDLEALGPVVRDFYAELRRLKPGVTLWFTAYPDRAQEVAHGGPWDDLVAGADFGLPQVYFSSQGERWDQIVADHAGKPVIATFSPGDWPDGWLDLAKTAAQRFGGVAVWRYPDTRNHASAIAELAATASEDDVTPEQLQQALLAALATDKGQQLVGQAVMAQLTDASVLDDATKAGSMAKVSFSEQLFNGTRHAFSAANRTSRLVELAQADPTKVSNAVLAGLKSAGVTSAVTTDQLTKAIVHALQQLGDDN